MCADGRRRGVRHVRGFRNEELTQLTTKTYLRDAGELYLPKHV